MNRKLILTLILVLRSSWLQAKIVDVSAETTKPHEQGLSLSLSGMYEANSGNSERERYNVGATIRYGIDKHQFLLMGNTEWGVLEGSQYLENDFLHSRYRYILLTWLDWGVFAQVDRNPFRGLSKRSLLGTGPRLSLQKEKWQAYWGLFYMSEKEEFLQEESQNNMRLSTFISISASFDDRISVFSTNYYQPKWNDVDDYRLLSNNGLSISISEDLSFDWSLNIIYDSKPPVGVEKQDRRISQSLTYKL